uniref:Uncharacterized protein n=1 Tax=Anguilla anguilla TaxID=7936 RepID=A0A0E9RXD5_ANGAN
MRSQRRGTKCYCFYCLSSLNDRTACIKLRRAVRSLLQSHEQKCGTVGIDG